MSGTEPPSGTEPADRSPDPRRPTGQSSRASFTSRAVILALVSAALLFTLAVPVRAWFAQRAQIAGLRSDVDAAQDRVRELQIEKQRWNDPAFVAAEARRRLHFVLPGEVGYVTLGSGSAAAATSDDGVQPPWYTELWGALQRADDHGSS